MSFICKVFYTLPGSDDVHHLKWMNTQPDIAVYKTKKKYKAALIVDSMTYEPHMHANCPRMPDDYYTSFATNEKGAFGRDRATGNVLKEGKDYNIK